MDMLVIAIIALVAFAVVLIPLMRRGTASAADAREFAMDDDVDDTRVMVVPESAQAVAAGATATPRADDAIEREVLRYRTALRSGTLCARCGQANPPESVFCSDCGKKLPLTDAKEFE